MPLRDTLQTILTDYPEAKGKALTGHPLGIFIRQTAPKTVEEALGGIGAGLHVKGAAGAGSWAAVPWISIFDPAVTTSATQGYYAVYLFHVNAPVVHLSLNQGTTAVREEFGTRTREILRNRADLMRKRISDFASKLLINEIELGSDARLPGDYAAGHALGVSYALNALPEEARLRSDLQTIVHAYRALTYRGGIDAETDRQEDLTNEFPIPPNASIIEIRKYAYHRKIERNRTAVRYAKKFHGYRCQACDLNFSERYGMIGKDFIEAHHLRPISDLEESVAVKYDVATDFAVLCANCHRMIHRFPNPGDLVAFRKFIN